jgi:hypothetical protein
MVLVMLVLDSGPYRLDCNELSKSARFRLPVVQTVDRSGLGATRPVLLQSTSSGQVRATGIEMTDTAWEWQLDHAPGSESAVEVFVRSTDLPDEAVGAAAEQLSLRGPYCDLTRMLPAAFRLEPLAPRVWHTTVINPCYWTPLSPAYYRLETGELAGGVSKPAAIVGLRRLEVRGTHLLLEGRRWVFRAARADQVTLGQIDAWHESLLGVLVDELDERLLEAASRRGVPVMIELNDSTPWARLRRATRWPAVQLALLPATASSVVEGLLAHAPNVLRTAHIAPGDATLPDWAQAVLCEVDDRDKPKVMVPAGVPRPLLVAGPRALQCSAAADRDPAQVRRSCEQLQQRLGALWDISGYLV